MTTSYQHDILMITHNRANYTRRSLERVLDTCDDQMRVWVWHNGSDAETMKVIESFRTHPNFYRYQHSPENKRLREPTNWFWAQSDADFVSKIDDDCLLPDGWSQTLIAALETNPKLGVIGCWRFYDEDFVPELAERKIRPLNGGHRLMANCWVQGSGYVMRRAVISQMGPIQTDMFYHYCIRAAMKGWDNGWYFPFIHEEHMDDPRSIFCEMKNDEQFLANRPLSAIHDNVTSLAQWAARVRYMARTVQEASLNPRDHIGWRRRVRTYGKRMLGSLLRRDNWRNAARK